MALEGIQSCFARRPYLTRSFPRLSIFDYCWKNWKSQSTCYGKGSRRLQQPHDPSFAIGLKRGEEEERKSIFLIQIMRIIFRERARDEITMIGHSRISTSLHLRKISRSRGIRAFEVSV